LAVWRLIVNEGELYWCMALDEAMLQLREQDKIPNTLRLYRILPSGVTIGYFQRVKDSVNLDYIREHEIPLTRRITGGGSVYHDGSGEVTYSVVADISDVGEDVLESYQRICRGIVYALRIFGVRAEFKPINDVVVDGKKISGSAQTRKKKALLQHGTFMYATDLDKLSQCLRAPREKLESHGVSSIRDRVTTLSEIIGRRPGLSEVLEALKKGFSQALGVELKPSRLTKEELLLAEKLIAKYKDEEWVFRK